MRSSYFIVRKFVIAVFVTSLFLVCNFPLRAAESERQTDDDALPTFSKCWDYPMSPNLTVGVESDGESVYIIDTERSLVAVDLATGTKLWSSELAGEPISNLLVTNSVVVVASQASGDKAILRAVSKTTGITQWSADLPSAASVAIGSLNGTVVTVASSGLAAAFYTDRGTPSWTKQVGASITTAPFFHGRTLILGTARKELVAISIPGGEMTVFAKLDGTPTSVFSLEPESVLIGDDRGNLVQMSIKGKRDWKFRNGARITAIAGYDSEYLATSHDNFLYKLTRSGNVEWKRRLSARIDRRPIIIEKSAVISTVGDGNVYVIDLGNGKILNRIETGEEASVQAARGERGFAIVSTRGVMFYSRETCPAENKKTVPAVAAPSGEKS